MFFGELAVLSDIESFSSAVVVDNGTILARIHRTSLIRCMDVQPRVVAKLASMVLSFLSPVVRQIDFALDWVRSSNLDYDTLR